MQQHTSRGAAPLHPAPARPARVQRSFRALGAPSTQTSGARASGANAGGTPAPPTPRAPVVHSAPVVRPRRKPQVRAPPARTRVGLAVCVQFHAEAAPPARTRVGRPRPRIPRACPAFVVRPRPPSHRVDFLASPCVPSSVSVIRTPKLPLLPVWEKGVGGMRGKGAWECSTSPIAPKNSSVVHSAPVVRPRRKPQVRAPPARTRVGRPRPAPAIRRDRSGKRRCRLFPVGGWSAIAERQQLVNRLIDR